MSMLASARVLPQSVKTELTIGVQSEGVGVVQGLAGGESSGSRVAVAKVISAWGVDSWSVGELVEHGGGLVLCL